MERGAVIVAHPDDETIWCGGTLLLQAHRSWDVAALTRGSDPDRAPKFRAAARALGVSAGIGDLDDGPEQTPLAGRDVEEAILSLLPGGTYDLLLTHSPNGEYTRHRRHEETARAVAALWEDGRIRAGELWMFAYEDGGKRYPPRPIEDADRTEALPESVWREKRRIITEIYDFPPGSFEAMAASARESFWCFPTADAYSSWLENSR